MQFENPLTGEKVDLLHQEEYIDYVLHLFNKTITELDVAEKSKKILVQLIDKLTPDQEKKSGAVKLVGVDLKATITRKQNISYDKVNINGVEVSPLQIAYEKLPATREAINIKFEEKAAFAKWLETADITDEVVKMILEKRKCNPGTPSVEVKSVER